MSNLEFIIEMNPRVPKEPVEEYQTDSPRTTKLWEAVLVTECEGPLRMIHSRKKRYFKGVEVFKHHGNAISWVVIEVDFLG